MVEENSVCCKHAIALAVVLGHPEGIHLGRPVGASVDKTVCAHSEAVGLAPNISELEAW